MEGKVYENQQRIDGVIAGGFITVNSEVIVSEGGFYGEVTE